MEETLEYDPSFCWALPTSTWDSPGHRRGFVPRLGPQLGALGPSLGPKEGALQLGLGLR